MILGLLERDVPDLAVLLVPQLHGYGAADAPLHDSDSMIMPSKLPMSHTSIPFSQAPSSMATYSSSNRCAQLLEVVEHRSAFTAES